MGVSFCISVLIMFIWSNLTFGPVQSRSFSGIPDESKLTGQIMVGLCLRRCGLSFQAFNAKIYREELPLDHFCYTKCIGKEGKHNSSVKERNLLVNPHNTPSFERIKRGASNSVKNQTSLNTSVVPNGERIKPTSFNAFGRKWLQKCLMNKPRTEKSFTADDVKVTYEELNSTGRYIATLSWTPFDIQAANWTGYGIIYKLLDPFSPSQRVYGLCQELDKNATKFAITNSSYGLKNGSSIAHYITSLPYPVEIPFYSLFTCKVPKPCFTFSNLDTPPLFNSTDQPTTRTGYAIQFTAQRRLKSTAQRRLTSTGGDEKSVTNMAAAISSTCAVVLILFLLSSSTSVSFIA